MGEFSHKEIQETKPTAPENFRDIKPETPMTDQEADNFWDSEFQKASEIDSTNVSDGELKKDNIENNRTEIPEKTDINETPDYYTREEKIDFADRSDGEWSGEHGNSEFRPNDAGAQKDLEKYGQDCIEYKDGNPDFSKVSEGTVEISNMTSDRPSNFKQAYEEIAKQWNDEGRDNKTDWTRRDVRQWKHENHYDLHERADMKTMDLIPHDVHMACKHIGGIAESKRAESSGGEFDE